MTKPKGPVERIRLPIDDRDYTTADGLAELETLCAEISESPWEGEIGYGATYRPGGFRAHTYADIAFIRAARVALPQLLDVVRTLHEDGLCCFGAPRNQCPKPSVYCREHASSEPSEQPPTSPARKGSRR